MRNRTIRLCYCALMCALIILSTQLFRFTIPGTDVMITLQVFFVLLCGQLLPPRYCLYILGLYLIAGIVGLPVFSALNGPAVFSTPSAGYLIGFTPAACICSLIRRKANGKRYFASLIGLVILYFIALLYLVILSQVFTAVSIGMTTLVTQYCLLFLPLDIVKAIAAAWMGHRLSRISSIRHLDI